MKVFTSLFFSVIVYGVVLAKHPFVGQYVDVPSLTRPDGTLTMRLNEQPVKYNKYDHIIDKSFDGRKDKNIIQEVIEDIQTDNEEERNSLQSAHKIRLGDSVVTGHLDTVGGAMWTGQVLMGRFTPMDLVFDTGSDWLVVESN